MPGDMNTAEIQQTRHAGQEGLKQLYRDFQPPQSIADADRLLADISLKKEKLFSARLPDEQKKKVGETLNAVEFEMWWQRGELTVATPYFSGLEKAILQEMTGLQKEGRDKFGRKQRTYEVEGKKVDEAEARKEAAARVLSKRVKEIEKTTKDLEEKTSLTTEEEGKRHACQIIDNYAHSLVVSVATGAIDEIARAITNLEKKEDNLGGLETGEAKEVMGIFGAFLPEDIQLKALAEDRDVVKGLNGEKTTYSAGRVVGNIEKAGREILGKRPTLQELSAGNGLDLEKAAKERIKGIVSQRAERIYQKDDIDFRDFDKVAERMVAISADKKEEDRWRLLARFRYYARQSVPVFTNAHTAFQMAQPDIEQAKIKGESWLLPPEDQIALLEDPEIRKEVAENYKLIRSGDVVFGEKGNLYKMRPDGEAIEPIGNLPLPKRIAFELLHSWCVHPDPFKEQHGTGRKPIAWSFFKGVHDSLYRLYPYDKWARASAGIRGKKLFEEAIGTKNFTLILEDPRNPGRFFMGDYLQLMGVKPEELLTKWESFKSKGFSQVFRPPGWFWNRIKKGVETANAWGGLFEAGSLDPQSVWQKLGHEQYDYIPPESADVRDAILGPVFRLADEYLIYTRLITAARTTGNLNKGSLYDAVTSMGLRMTDLYEMTGIYFTNIPGRGSVKDQIKSFIRMHAEYLAANPNAPHISDQEYIMAMTGIDITREIPNTYDDWRLHLIENLRRFEGFRVTPDEFLAQIKERGLGRYAFKNSKSKRLAELLINDPVDEVLGKLLATVQEKNMLDFTDWITQKNKSINAGMLPSEREKLDMADKLRQLTADALLTDAQYEKALKGIKDLPVVEKMVDRLRTVDGWINQRFPSPLTLAIAFVGEIVTLTKWRRENSGLYEWCRKWLGISPFSTAVGLGISGSIIGIEWWINGVIPAWNMWTSTLFNLSLLSIGITDLVHLINERLVFTRVPYELYPYRPRKRG